LDDVVRTDPPHGRECRLASSPDLRAFGVVDRLAQFERTRRAAMLFDLDAVGLDLCLRSIQLDDEHRTRPGWVTTRHGGFGSLDRECVHHLDRSRHDPRRDDLAHRGTGLIHRAKGGEQRAHGLRRPRQTNRYFGRDAESPLATNERTYEVIARWIRRISTEPLDTAVRQHDFESGDVMCREAVLQAMRAAGVLRHIATDRADLLARRIRRVEITM